MSSGVVPSRPRPPPEVVVYVDPSKRKKANPKTGDDTSMAAESVDSNEGGTKKRLLTLHRARFDVHKFGINGFTKEKREEAKVQLAVKLGAKPPRNKHYNYKEFIVMRKEEKDAELEKRRRDRAMGLKVKKPKKSRKNQPRGLNCQVGRFNGGMLTVPNRLIKKPGGR